MKMEEIKDPIGKLIIDSGLGEMTQNGLYLQYADVITMMRTYAESQVKLYKPLADEYMEGKKDIESQLKEAKELLKSANPIWKENCAKWGSWHTRVKKLI